MRGAHSLGTVANSLATIPAIVFSGPARARMMLSGILLAILMFVPVTAAAVAVDGLYEAQSSVAGQSPAQQRAAYARGLRQVLLRVSGSRDVLADERLQSLLNNAESLLQSYQYQTVQNGQDQMRMTFGAVAVNQALADLNAPVWGANRPLLLGWVAVDSGRDRYLVSTGAGGSEQGLWASEFAAAASDRGLPLSLPPADVADKRGLLSEIRGQFMEKIRQASAPYTHNLLSVVNVTRRSGNWDARWQLEGPGFSESDEVRGAASPAALASQVVDAWADFLAGRYAVAAGEVSEGQRVDLIIENINSMASYGAVLGSLDGMTPVMDAGPSRIKANMARFRVAFSGELSVLEDYIALDDRFEKIAGPPQADTVTEPSPETAQDRDSQKAQPVTAQAGGEGTSGQSQADADPLQYTAATDAKEADTEQEEALESQKRFESLYPVLRYRWRGDGVVGQGER